MIFRITVPWGRYIQKNGKPVVFCLDNDVLLRWIFRIFYMLQEYLPWQYIAKVQESMGISIVRGSNTFKRHRSLKCLEHLELPNPETFQVTSEFSGEMVRTDSWSLAEIIVKSSRFCS